MSHPVLLCLPRWGADYSLYVFLSWMSFVAQSQRDIKIFIPLSGSIQAYRDSLFPNSLKNEITVTQVNSLGSEILSKPALITIDEGDIPSINPEILEKGVFILGLSLNLSEIVRVKNLTKGLIASGIKRSQCQTLVLQDSRSSSYMSELLEKEMGPPSYTWVIPERECQLGETQKQLICHEKGSKRLKKEFSDLISVFSSVESHQKEKDKEGGEPFVTNENLEERILERFWEVVGQLPQDRSKNKNILKEKLNQTFDQILLRSPRMNLSSKETQALHQKVHDVVFGLGLIEPYFRDSEISEIMVNGPHNIYLEKAGVLHRSDKKFKDHAQLRFFVDRLVGQAGRRVDFSSPVCDVRLDNGARANVTLPPISLQGPVLTIRKFKRQFLSFEDLVSVDAISLDQANTLKRIVEQRKNILVSGNSGAGKTTLLNILSTCIDEAERIITLEDTAELELRQSHVVRFETRNENNEGKGRVSLKDLVINALRMRPDRLLVGECRGEEVIPMLQAMNTGHDGSMTTLHANSAFDVPRRLESLVLMGAPHWPISVVRQQIASALNVVVHLRRQGAKRKLEKISSLQLKNGVIEINDLD